MNAVDIRRMKIEDADEIGAISTAITQQPAGVDFKRIIEEQLRQEKNACYVAEIEGNVVGFMISHIQSGGFGLKESAWIVQLGVEPACQVAAIPGHHALPMRRPSPYG